MSNLRIGYLILAHEKPERLFRLIDKLHNEDISGQILIHYDRSSDHLDFHRLKEHYSHHKRVYVLSGKQRIYCNWGEYSLVQATVNMIIYSLKNIPYCDYYYLLSGACYPIQPLENLKNFLIQHKGKAFIECQGPEWIKSGIREDRYFYRHYLNFRKQPWLFRRMYWIQRYLGLKRTIPAPLKTIYFGSQWWCMPRPLLEKIIKLIDDKALGNFFKRVWIADECFFQTLASLYTEQFQITRYTLTHYDLDDKGQPRTFSRNTQLQNPHKYFIRKIE